MSELTRCNYCTMQEIVRRAEKDNMKVTKSRKFTDFGMGGTDIFVHPHDVSIKELSKEDADQYCVAWFMQLPGFCCC